ncbi:Histone-lysine N-methyltransferase SUVR4 [Vitis vinifera]|uniref:Histone-lysine N-methyltransferase SUVR4 n=1 Tax=Vitis vinifera TaxID=29760 RepID=A0A438GYC9_VITVI|nr:Histone-lysine N-methyltransferase SUVR4 [Vitis vinifera]
MMPSRKVKIPKAKILKACNSMKAMGIAEELVRPVLNDLANLYDNNWALIEDENYRVLIDAIFEQQEVKGTKSKAREEEASLDDESEDSELPLKRLCSRQQKDALVAMVDSVAGDELVKSVPLLPPEGVSNKYPETRPILREKEPPQPCLKDQRGRSDPLFPRTQVQDKGKKPIHPRLGQIENRLNYEKETHIECFKVPKIEPDCVNSPTEDAVNKCHNAPSIVPKNKTFTNDNLQLAVPLVVIHPASPSLKSEDGPSSGNCSHSKEDEHKVHESNYLDVADEANASGEDQANGVSDSSQFDIASSPNGEVKISLILNTSQQSGCHIPNLDAVSKALEDKCRGTYGITEPSFSVMKLMQEFCEYFLAIGADSTDDEKLKTMETSSTLDILKEPAAQDVLGRGDHKGKFCIPSSSSNGSVKCQNLVEVGQKIPRPIYMNGLDILRCTLTSNKVNKSCYIERDENLKVLRGPESLNSCGIVAVQKHCFSVDTVKPLQYFDDITKDEDCCSNCFGDCTSLAIPCACARETGGEFAYQQGGLVKEKFLEECISMNRDPHNHRLFYCKNCPLESKKCGNRVVQRGITVNLQVIQWYFYVSGIFTPEGKGWGLRTLENLPKGAFVCEYVGEIVTNTELYERNLRSTGKERHTYPVLLDADWGSEGVLKDEEALCLDATFYGNVARFINHRCFDANLVEIPVEVETPDHHYYHLAFFTTRKVDALEELTWDYGIDFDDHNHPVKAFRCCCGSKGCRDTRNSKRHGVKRRKMEMKA